MTDPNENHVKPNRDRLSLRIHCGTAVVVVPFLVSIAIAATGFARFQQNVDRLTAASHFATRMADVERDAVEMRQHVVAYTHGGNAGDADAVTSLGNTLLEKVDGARADAPDDESRGRLDRMHDHLTTYLGSFQEVVRERRLREQLVRENVLEPAHDVTRRMNVLSDDGPAATGRSSVPDEFARRIGTYVSLAEARLLQFLSDPDARLVDEGLAALRLGIDEWSADHPDGDDPVLARMQELEHGFLRTVQATRAYLYLAHVVMAGEAAEFAFHTEELKRRAEDELVSIGTAAEDDGRQTAQIVLVVSLAAAAVGVLISLMISRTILRPIRAITETFNLLSRGEVVGSVPGLDRRDEIGEMARAADVFRSRNRETVALLDTTRRMTDELDGKARELEKRNEDLDSFAYVASHDLKSPLRGVACLAEWIAEDAADVLSEESREHLDMMRQRVDRMDQLLDDLLAYSRAGRTGEEDEVVDVRELLTAIRETIDWPADTRLHVDPSLPRVVTTPVELQRVLQNLLTNAVKYRSQDAPEVAVEARPVGDDFVEFSVADSGIGIAPEYHDSVFQMFRRLHTQDEIEGSGMGLALVKKIVETHGGTIRVESEEGRGATFFFTWPTGRPDGPLAESAGRPETSATPLLEPAPLA